MVQPLKVPATKTYDLRLILPPPKKKSTHPHTYKHTHRTQNNVFFLEKKAYQHSSIRSS